jgi:hypothetical protein
MLIVSGIVAHVTFSTQLAMTPPACGVGFAAAA